MYESLLFSFHPIYVHWTLLRLSIMIWCTNLPLFHYFLCPVFFMFSIFNFFIGFPLSLWCYVWGLYVKSMYIHCLCGYPNCEQSIPYACLYLGVTIWRFDFSYLDRATQILIWNLDSSFPDRRNVLRFQVSDWQATTSSLLWYASLERLCVIPHGTNHVTATWPLRDQEWHSFCWL